MKIIFILFNLLLSLTVLNAQVPAADTIVPAKGNIEQQLREIRKRQILLHSDSTKNDNVPKKTALVDTTKKIDTMICWMTTRNIIENIRYGNLHCRLLG